MLIKNLYHRSSHKLQIIFHMIKYYWISDEFFKASFFKRLKNYGKMLIKIFIG